MLKFEKGILNGVPAPFFYAVCYLLHFERRSLFVAIFFIGVHPLPYFLKAITAS